ncbi:uncharacterized protein METZ01_LOCUS105902 [marine metagenome]|uniref:Uncharacterized protein n=1 Tax=marine metagenome TaxID=408172 RepID=A0A381WLH8_9ZZZZ
MQASFPVTYSPHKYKISEKVEVHFVLGASTTFNTGPSKNLAS